MSLASCPELTFNLIFFTFPQTPFPERASYHSPLVPPDPKPLIHMFIKFKQNEVPQWRDCEQSFWAGWNLNLLNWLQSSLSLRYLPPFTMCAYPICSFLRALSSQQNYIIFQENEILLKSLYCVVSLCAVSSLRRDPQHYRVRTTIC